jgi:hypothetical protein
MRLARGPDWQPNGGDRAVDALSAPGSQVIYLSALIVVEHALVRESSGVKLPRNCLITC